MTEDGTVGIQKIDFTNFAAWIVTGDESAVDVMKVI